jgi:hypothetical protein
MNTTLAIPLAQSLSLIACILFAVWYVVPWLESRSGTEALVPLVWVHVMRNFALQLPPLLSMFLGFVPSSDSLRVG